MRELKRVLMGEAVRYVSADFDHPDTGIVFGLDEEQCVIIVDIEADSAAARFPFLIQKMRLYRINDFQVRLHNEKALNEVLQELLRLHDTELVLEFYEPTIIVNKFSCYLDIEVEDDIYSVVLPIGAVYNHKIFCEKLQRLMAETSIMLSDIMVDFVPEKRQIVFSSEEEAFRLLFASGPNFRRSCRYTLGFEAEDLPYAHEHAGQPMLMDLKLGVSPEKADILMDELFTKYDRDGSGEFEFEEFRDFYIRYLDSDDSLDRLRRYASYRFRDIEHEKFVLKQKQDRINRARRRDYLKVKNAKLVEAQKDRFRNDSYVDAFGIRRRIYRHRTVNRLTSEGDKKIILDKPDEEKAEDEFAELLNQSRAIVAAAVTGKTGVAGTEKEEGKKDVEAEVDDTNNKMFNATILTKIEAKARSRYIQKQKQQQQTIRRKKIMQQIIEANRNLQVQRRENAKLHQHEMVNMQTMDLQYRIKRELADSVQVSNNTLFENVKSYGVDVSNLITSPAVKIGSGVFGATMDKDAVDVETMQSSQLHPASLYYFHMKENQVSSRAVFDSQRFNPVFFTADYVRQPSRHSNLTLSLMKTMRKVRDEGVQYRLYHGMAAQIEYKCPPEEDLDALLAEKARIAELYDKFGNLKDSTQKGGVRKKVSFQDQEPIKGQENLVARLTVLSIKVDNLPSMHAFEKNSPFVNIFCGAYKFATESYSFAGKNHRLIILLIRKIFLKFLVLLFL